MTRTDTDADPDRTRRTALKILGTTAATTGLTAAGAAQDTETDDESDGGGNETDEVADGDVDDGESDQLPIILAGCTEYWYGVAPEKIEGEENPTLQFEAGQEYELVWINVDSAEHELLVETDDGEELEASDASETAGEAVSMTVEANEDAAEYYCEYHPENMRGDVELGEAFDLEPHEHGEHEDHEHEHDHGGTNESDRKTGGNEYDE